MIEVKNLTKNYGSHVAVDDISFSIAEGEIIGFLGPNGAGKSTTMNMLTGYLSATAGDIVIDGHDILNEPNEAKASIGYLPELPPLYMDMTVREYLNFMYDLKKCKLPRAAHIAEICRIVKIEGVFERLIKNLSKGYRQRIGIAQALIGNPPVLILDEPTVGLDPMQIIEIRTLIKTLGKHHTVILSSHILPEVEAVCDRLIIINRGHIVANATPKQLSEQYAGSHHLTVRVAGAEDAVVELVKKIPGVKKLSVLGTKEPGSIDLLIEQEDDADIRAELFSRLAARHWPILSLKSSERTLEEIFTALINQPIVNGNGGDRA